MPETRRKVFIEIVVDEAGAVQGIRYVDDAMKYAKVSAEMAGAVVASFGTRVQAAGAQSATAAVGVNAVATAADRASLAAQKAAQHYGTMAAKAAQIGQAAQSAGTLLTV